MSTLVLLPGMDGTGALFDFLLPHLPGDLTPKVIRYPADAALSYKELTNLVIAQLPTQPFVLLGESFSGPVALAVAERVAPAAVILVCTFATNPRPSLGTIKPLIGWLPSPRRFIGPLAVALMGKHRTPALRSALARSLESVAPAVLRHRAASALSVDARSCLANLQCPVLYLQAAQDRVVPRSCAQEVRRIQPATKVVQIEGPHFLLQSQPAAAARAIEHFLREVENAA
jgi:pimeloyl-[acyl-carrier protein] methyl ester esterase